MGSFNLACAVSNIPIGYGDPCVGFILKASNAYRDIRPGATGYWSGDVWPDFHYNIASDPIFGNYDDYGRIVPDGEFDFSKIEHLRRDVKDKHHADHIDEKNFNLMLIHAPVYQVLLKIKEPSWATKWETARKITFIEAIAALKGCNNEKARPHLEFRVLDARSELIKKYFDHEYLRSKSDDNLLRSYDEFLYPLYQAIAELEFRIMPSVYAGQESKLGILTDLFDTYQDLIQNKKEEYGWE